MLKLITNDKKNDSNFVNVMLRKLYQKDIEILSKKSLHGTQTRVIRKNGEAMLVPSKEPLSPENKLAMKEMFFERLKERNAGIPNPDVYLNTLISSAISNISRKQKTNDNYVYEIEL